MRPFRSLRFGYAAVVAEVRESHRTRSTIAPTERAGPPNALQFGRFQVSIEKSPAGSRGARQPPPLLGKLLMPLMVRLHRRSGDRFQGMDLLYLTTTGARSGAERTTPLARFDDGHGGWFVVASAGGSPQHPAWYHSMAAHPDKVFVEVSRKRHRVAIDQLRDSDYEQAWTQIVQRAPRFAKYRDTTDRQIPMLHLTPTS
jgi:deazaflavin-dependent oxidoreductase (nitroreductase family)